MNRKIRFAAALIAAALVPAAQAQTVPVPKDLGYVKDKPVLTLDPDTSYIIVRSKDAAPFSFIRIADADDLADYKARRAVALEKAHKKWVRKHASWAKDREVFLKAPKGPYAAPDPGPEPIEPTDANLAFTPIDVENLISFGPINRFAKGDVSTYMFGVRPGRYAFYGPVIAAPNGAYAGACMCMGTFEFEVKRGEIRNVGTMMTMLAEEREKAKAVGKPVPKNALDLPDAMTSTSWKAPVADDRVDPRLAGFTVLPAELHASRRVPNYLGLEIDRLMPIDGVLAYQRDKVIDVRSGKMLP